MMTSAITTIPSGGCATVGDGSYNSYTTQQWSGESVTEDYE